MAQGVKNLLCKDEGLSSVPSIQVKYRYVACISDPSAQRRQENP